MKKVWEYYSTEQIVFGIDAIYQLDSILRRLLATNVLIVTDSGIKATGILDKVNNILQEKKYKTIIYDNVLPEPSINSVLDCVKFAINRMSEIDVIIGLGGGSCIDMAKSVSLLIEHGGHPNDYIGENLVPGPIKPIIAIPTTAGTGSEVTSVSVLTDEVNNLKVGISDNYIRPKIALLDPNLTLKLPPYITACSGMDALAHAIESFTAKDFAYVETNEENLIFQGALPISDIYAIKAIELIINNLYTAVHQGNNVEARKNMMFGSMLAGMALSNSGTASAHALAYPIGGLVEQPHGAITGLLLPYVVEYNGIIQQEKMYEIAQMINTDFKEKINKLNASKIVSDYLLNLLRSIGLPTKLSEIGIEKEQLPEIAEKSVKIERIIRNNPRIPDKDSFITLLDKAL